jgi:hypothetical protein
MWSKVVLSGATKAFSGESQAIFKASLPEYAFLRAKFGCKEN